MSNDTRVLVAVNVPGSRLPLQTDGVRLAALRPIVEYFGLDYAGQFTKLKGKSWACVEKFSTQLPGDTQRREVTGVDRRTLGMWLATLDENRVREDLRPELRSYQAEAADALDAHFHGSDLRGENPHAAREHETNASIFAARAQIELCQAAKGLIHPDHLEARARVILARGLGEYAELDSGRKPLYSQDYLREKNLSRSKMKSIAGTFGKRVKAAYTAQHGQPPGMYPLDLPNGQTREVAGYTEADRKLMDAVWDRYYNPNAHDDQLPIDGEVIA